MKFPAMLSPMPLPGGLVGVGFGLGLGFTDAASTCSTGACVSKVAMARTAMRPLCRRMAPGAKRRCQGVFFDEFLIVSSPVEIFSSAPLARSRLICLFRVRIKRSFFS